MINEFNIVNVASYDTDGIEVTNLKKINFIYGANGCGKTTISNYLVNPSGNQFDDCSIIWEGARALKTLAYNKQFRDDNLETGTIAGIFTLGQATKDEIESINSKKAEVSSLHTAQVTQQATLEAQQERLKTLTDTFTDDCWSVYKQHEVSFKEALYGSINSKVSFRDKIISEKTSNLTTLLSLDDLQSRAATLLGSKPDRVLSLNTISTMELKRIEQDSIWQKVIVGKNDVDIAGLISKLGNSDWVNQGRNYIGEDQTCPFCQKSTVDDLFTQQIEEYFDESYVQDKSTLTTLQEFYSQECESILVTLEQIETNEKNNSVSKLNIEVFSAYLKAIHSQLSKNKLLIQEKIDKTSQLIELTDTKTEFDNIFQLIVQANTSIASHNQLVDNYGQEVSALKSSVWRFLVDVLINRIDTYEKDDNCLQLGIEQINSQIQTRNENIRNLDNEIVELSKNVTSVQPAVDEINRSLKAYGFTNFKIVPSSELANHYAIQRENGELAHHTMSEGEITFITFLYFVQLAKGALDQHSVTEDRILVIDDPISSLDSNILYVVSTIVKELIKTTKESTDSIKQLLLLTHNVYFHKEASFQGSRSNGDKDTHFWILRKNQNITSIQPHGQDNPIESSYELLWREIKEWRNNSGITLQNTMRRIIEGYFKILGKYTDEGLIEKFDTFEEQQICRSLVSWINDGSHTIPDDLYVQTPDDSAENYLAVFKKVFEYTNNHGHYRMMMGAED